MSDYIKREDALNECCRTCIVARKEAGLLTCTVKCFEYERINAIPAADVVEVVRCKDCKYVEPTKGGDKDKLPHFCTIHREKFYDGEEYCSFGRRKE